MTAQPQPDVSALIDEGLAADTAGWDFDRFADRQSSTPPPWDYGMLAAGVATGPLLDMGTGGGEWLEGWLGECEPVPRPVLATEGWAPNVPVAGARLRRLGVTVVQVDGAIDNVDRDAQDWSGRLPFASDSFATVLNRHESYAATEVARVLRPGGTFLTQQVGSDGERGLRELLDLPAEPADPAAAHWTLRFAVDQAAAGGLTVVDGGVGTETTSYHDIAPLVWFLRQVPWALPGFDPGRERDRLRAVQDRIDHDGLVRVRRPYFWFRATQRVD